MTFDWSYFTGFDDDTIILKEFTKRDLALLSSAMSLFELETDWINGTWDTIEQKLSEIQWRLSHDTYVCPPGGSADYTLELDIELVADATTYTIDNLNARGGTDLLIEFTIATTSTGRRDLRYHINDKEADEYSTRYNVWLSSVTYYNTEQTFGHIKGIAPATATPQLLWGFVSMNFIDYKNTGRYTQGNFNGFHDNAHVEGNHQHRNNGDLNKLELWLSSGDIKTGTKIRVYSRG